MSKESLFDEFTKAEKKEPEPDMCKCSECGQSFKVSDCHQDHEPPNGWEMPAYTQIDCSGCTDGGCVDDFFFSGEANE